ncbi:MAG: Clp1/GlmU family protein [bacterium]
MNRKLVIDEIISNAHVVMVIGHVDTGKSTFCCQLASAALEHGLKVGIVDSDVGQSWIGPPTTIGMKIVEKEPFSTLFPDSFYFVGSITPEKHLLQMIVGSKCMVEKAISLGADLVIIDTTGLVNGRIGRALKQNKIDIIKPDHLVCFQRNSELETLLKGVESCCNRVYRLEPSRFVEKKSQEYRSKYRQEQFNKYFSESETQCISFSELHGQRETFLNGRKANEAEKENISKIINKDILYAEWSYRGLFIVIDDYINWEEMKCLCSSLKIDELILKRPSDFTQMLVALLDSHGNTLCLGIIEEVDFFECIFTIRFKKDFAKASKIIQFSNFKMIDCSKI